MKDISFPDAVSVYLTPEEAWDPVQVCFRSLTICDHKPLICVPESLFSFGAQSFTPFGRLQDVRR